MQKILVIDDEPSMRELLAIMLRKEGFEVLLADSRASAAAVLAKGPVPMVITDVKLPDGDGIEILRHVKAAAPETVVIVMTAFGSTQTAVAALKLGAHDYLIKPFDIEELRIVVSNALEKQRLQEENLRLKAEFRTRHGLDRMVGVSSSMAALFELVRSIAPTGSTVLVTGESGTGKELVGRAIHASSARAAGPFIAVDCGAIAEGVLESELFGHARGSFTGATGTRRGLFEEASAGTLFLDEIGDIGPRIQGQLLRVLQEGEIRRVGESAPVKVDTRVVAATNKDLAEHVRTGKFREDLFYRLNVVTIRIPPLRERREDIPLLAEHFAARHAGERGATLTTEAREALLLWDWPGNVRELDNAVARALALNPGGTILPEDLPEAIRERWRPRRGPPVKAPAVATPVPVAAAPDPLLSDHPTLDELNRRYAERVLRESGGNKTRAAEALGIDRKTLSRLLREE